jgi:hypothetical protein
MDERKAEWIRHDLGMTKVEFVRELGIQRMAYHRWRRYGFPRYAGLAVLGLWYSRKMGGLLEEPGVLAEPEKAELEPKRKPKTKATPKKKNAK